MQRFRETFQTTRNGTVVLFPLPTITITLAGTDTLATIYSDNGVTTQSNPFTGTTTGEASFYAADGRYDVKASRAGFPDAVLEDVLLEDGGGRYSGTDGARLVGYAWASSNADPITVEDALRHEFVLERAYRSTDLGKWGPAFQRLANNPDCKVINIAGTQQSVFNVSGTVALDRSNLTITTPGRWDTTVNLEGSDPYLFDFGGTSAVRYNNYLKNLILTRNNAAGSGAMVRLRNIYLWGLHNTRMYMLYKAWRGMEIISSSYGRSYENLMEFPIREHIYMAGGLGPAGSVGGWVVSNQWKGLTVEGGHHDTANPLDQGNILMDDNVSACWFIDVEGYRNRGYMFYGRGTLANRSRNILNLIYNPNIECSVGYPLSGTARFDNYAANQIRKGWSEGNNCAAVWFTANAQSNNTSDLQIGIKTASSGVITAAVDETPVGSLVPLLAGRVRVTLDVVLRNFTVGESLTFSGVAGMTDLNGTFVIQAIVPTESAVDVTLTTAQTYINNGTWTRVVSLGGTYGVRDAGTNNTRNNIEYVGYDAGVVAGLRYDSTVERPVDTELTILQAVLGVSSAASSTANVNIRQMRYKSLVSGPFDSNLQGTSNATICDVVSQDDAATPFATAAPSLSLFPGYPVYYVDDPSGPTNIDNMPAGYMGEVRTLRLRTAGTVIRDTTTSGNNIVLRQSGVSYVATGRGAISFQWEGTLWYEISRTAI